jgi:hypothetical protein
VAAGVTCARRWLRLHDVGAGRAPRQADGGTGSVS